MYSRCLVYIGLAARQTFGVRVPVHRWDSGSENDPDKIEIYVGRLKGIESPTDEDQMHQIKLAEALLIHAHGPAYNTQYGKTPPKGLTHADVRVLNWGAVRSLHREVSGLLWTDAGDAVQHYKTFERHAEVEMEEGDIEQ